jgi:putative ATPase
LDADALDLLKGFADGDGRRFLNLLEQVTNAASGAGKTVVDGEFAKLSTSPSLRRFDKGGDEFYWQLSAFHKSLRGSDPDAALYWLARILDGSGDVSQVTRRMVVWPAKTSAMPTRRRCNWRSMPRWLMRLGSPKAKYRLPTRRPTLLPPQVERCLCRLEQAKAFVKNSGSLPVPLHLRNAPTKLMQQMGYHEGYRYAHDEPNGYAAGQSYFPEGVARPGWYQPTDRGVERRLGERLTWLRSLDDGTLPEADA